MESESEDLGYPRTREPSEAARPLVQPDDVGPGLPELADGQMRPPESPSRRRLIRSFAVAGLIGSSVYLMWRLLFTIDMNAWFVAIPMLVLEVHHAFGLGLYTFSLWDLDPLPGWHPVDGTNLRVAVLIPTYDESPEVLLPVIGAALAVEPAHETWVLDDGNRPEIEQLAVGLGACYLAREENSDAKAGNLNNALAHLGDRVDVVAIVDADHVVLRDFLRHTLGYFEDPDVAVVQTPQDFYNLESFEHVERPDSGFYFSEQSVFYRIIMPAKNRWDAVFWCGTGALVRVEALNSVGGVATDSITEDIHTSIKMHKRGWRIVAHNEVLARGLAASDATQYMLQRQRWARGAMQVMRSERLLTSSELTIAQRIAYSATLWAWFDSLRTLLFVALPIAVLATGVMPIDAPLRVFGPLFLGSFLIQYAALRFLARGYYPPWLSLVFETLRMPAVVPALGEVIRRTKARFNVTPKGRTGDGRERIWPPALLISMFAFSVVALLWGALSISGLTPLHYGNPGAMAGTSVFLAINMVLLIAATRRIIDPKYAGERRASVRFPVDMAGLVDGIEGRVEDLSLTGAQVRVGALGVSDPGSSPSAGFRLGQEVSLELPHQGVGLDAKVMRVVPDHTLGPELGLDFEPGQWSSVRDLALVLFHGGEPGEGAGSVRDHVHLLADSA